MLHSMTNGMAQNRCVEAAPDEATKLRCSHETEETKIKPNKTKTQQKGNFRETKTMQKLSLR